MIEDVIQFVLTRTRPISGADLTGFCIDAGHYFGESTEYLSNPRVEHTGDPAAVLQLTAELASNAQRILHATAALQDVWRELRYQSFEATSLQVRPQGAELRFITVPEGSKYCVTGRMVVGGPHYERLHRKERW